MPDRGVDDVDGDQLARLERRVDELARDVSALRARLGELITSVQRNERGGELR